MLRFFMKPEKKSTTCRQTRAFGISQSNGFVIRMKNMWKTARITLLIVFFYYVTFLPNEIFRIMTFSKDSLDNISFRANVMRLVTFCFVNSCINSYNFWYGNRRFRSTWCNVFRISNSENTKFCASGVIGGINIDK